MPPIDLNAIKTAVAIAIGVLTIFGTIFGWFGQFWHWLLRFFGAPLPE
jgi:hypothetical protein